jgi:hypothetical protein
MKASNLHKFSVEQKAVIFDLYIKEIEALEYGLVRGTNQILERFEEIAIEQNFLQCPLCKRGGK